ncbi:DNA/RNA nuclease SfsA [Vagococcus sp. DIV0080]|uniref:Sugar fermentation stimulation protein homolog n=1 Tax=Candidatus Vagococcus giribetii TaxID=2230876 RepID=A0ABS3HWA2_9ENTE|nr:DNA/RNA nuclease SfsA [Vagococcus sp. DIV0080]MBO0477408.1 DNA/RNA nuclease SfsA [Vagococcus sp. DIV0080]
MAKYEAIEVVTFKERHNRFVATCINQAGEEIVTHVKNTGRCKELLIPGVKVAVNFQDKPTRKTNYDLVSVQKEGAWFNIDSQLPNQLVEEGIKQNKIKFDILKGNIISVKREFTYGDSRFDFLIETDKQEKLLIEVKGMTLENNQVGSFPDAPSTRALKHVTGLEKARREGYLTSVLFVVQFQEITFATINQEMQPDLEEAIRVGMADGLEVLAYNCIVTEETVTIHEKVPFKLKETKE